MPGSSKKQHDLDRIAANPGKHQEIQRGQGMRLSTDSAEIAQTHKRINRGYKLREDLVKQCKQIALDDDRNLYEIMEDALEQYIARRHEAKAAVAELPKE